MYTKCLSNIEYTNLRQMISSGLITGLDLQLFAKNKFYNILQTTVKYCIGLTDVDKEFRIHILTNVFVSIIDELSSFIGITHTGDYLSRYHLISILKKDNAFEYTTKELITIDTLSIFTETDNTRISELEKLYDEYVNTFKVNSPLDTILTTINIPAMELSNVELVKYINEVSHNLKMCKAILKELNTEKTLRNPFMVNSVGNRIKCELIKQNITQKELSNLTGIHYRTIKDICNNKVDITHQQLSSIANALNMSTGYIIHGLDDNITDKEFEIIKSLTDNTVKTKSEIAIFNFTLISTNTESDCYMPENDMEKIKNMLIGKHINYHAVGTKKRNTEYATIYDSFVYNNRLSGFRELRVKTFVPVTKDNSAFINRVYNTTNDDITCTFKLGTDNNGKSTIIEVVDISIINISY